ncbi:DUF982 domain-containing protein [Mesorhizobium sp. M4B.F.Ca.ET.049.02.1.2]|uniref:DUF982 domain-containing protein n=1 Tax=Mesorhizobium sp. M4B.F.Ca.ET.049.02.1.2 TaxID=2496752 RepID=UPI002479D70D|nr:DUF982 domain-containing protein [Mesorhizobium sp. M4B.F.Ca.ET.049.02.1.2]
MTHPTALRACCDAEDRHKPVTAAHHAFIDFARQVAILEDSISAMQWIAACKKRRA